MTHPLDTQRRPHRPPNAQGLGPLRRLLALLVACTAAAPAAAQDAVEALLYGPTLEPVPIVLIAIDSETSRVEYLDAEGERHTAGFDQVVRLSFPVEASAEEPPGPRLATTDGQVIVGRAGQGLVGVAGSSDVLRWRDADGMRAVEVSLDDLAWVTLLPGMEPPAVQPTDDVLLLPTGESLVGFVDAVEVGGVAFVIGETDTALTIEPTRVAGLWIANPMRAAPEPAVVLTTRSGSRWRGALGRSGGAAAFSTPMTQPVSGAEGLPVWQPVRLGEADHAGEDWPVVTRLDLPWAGRRLLPMADLPMEVVDGGAYFGVPAPPECRAGGAIALHAPITAAFDLPAAARRVVMTLELDRSDDLPEERYAWAGCVAVVRLGATELARVTIDAEQDTHRLNLALPSATGGRALTLALEEGVNGPVLDRVLLRDAEVLVLPE